MSARIPLRSRTGEVVAWTVVDDQDYDWVNQWRWGFSRYVMRTTPRSGGKHTTVRLHRELLGLATGDGLQGDHINRNRLDNRRSNLRIASEQTNRQNVGSRQGSTSDYRGVSWCTSREKWVAAVRVDGRTHKLGRFDDELEAARVASEFRRLHMPFAVEAA